MKKNLKQAAALTLGAAMLLSACEGGGTGSSASSAETTDTTAQEQKGDESTGEGEKQLTMAITSPWSSLSPFMANVNFDDAIMSLIFDKLVYIKAGGEFTSRLAESWEVSDDNSYITFHLNPDAKWHDGEPVTADDVVFTLDMLSDPDLMTTRRLFNVNIAGTDDNGVELSEGSLEVEAVDEHTVQMNFKRPMTETIFFSEIRALYIVPEHLLGDISAKDMAAADFWNAPVGSGPCVFESQVVGERVEMKANKDYYLGTPDFDKMTVRVVQSSNLLAGLMNGEIDFLAGGSIASLPLNDFAMAQQQENLNAESIPGGYAQFMIVNNESLSDLRVRQAIAHAIDKQKIVDNLLQGHGKIMNSLFAEGHKYYDPEIKSVAYDPEKAKELLAEAGWDSSKELKMLVPTGNQVREQSSVLIQQDLEAVGMKVSIQTADISTVMSTMKDGGADLGLLGGAFTGAEPNYNVAFYTKDGAYDLSRLQDTEFQELFAEIEGSVDTEETMELTKKLQQEVADKVPYLYLYVPDVLFVSQKSLEGLNPADFATVNWDIWNWKVNK